ncbi:kinesin-like protein KIN-UC isoform X2 [Rhodamnia argentea]|uniref:Kinesin-like protein KIN-UC isoform X2 n=1 Tax=Rhodamnia argentea TaxID=178133 RepID=A0A8B8MYJ3_9MYRT|nr:kinesin-like protein KIN-UC isoform X2 [Rhodamnia argentea]
MAASFGSRAPHHGQRASNSSHGSSSASSAAASSSTTARSNGNASLGQNNRPKPPGSRRSVTPTSRAHSNASVDEVSGRVRVAVRLRPRNSEDLLLDADYADCVELQPELKRLKLRKNNWNSESYRFDEVFTDTASQRRVYEVVAKPVVESVLSGYNGTIMAYGQTGTGKTYTVGRLGKDDASERGIMVRALEDIISNISHASDSVEVSYLQLYMESIQDLLSPEKINIPITEDPKTGELSLPGATVVNVHGVDHFQELLQIGEANRHAANTKLNTESSRSHAILMVNVRRYVDGEDKEETNLQDRDQTDLPRSKPIPIVRKSKLLIVDLAGSERLDKSGSEGHLLEEAKFINLSLTSLGKCINALAENSAHIPFRDSKLTRLLRDSFGGSARTSLIITIGPSARHYAETTGTIMFGQRAMKIVNMTKLREEFDYESLCRKLESQVDHLTAEVERLEKLRENDKGKLERQLKECEDSFSGAETLMKRSEFLEKENDRLESEMKDILNELNRQKDQNGLMHNNISELQTHINYIQEQQRLEASTYQSVLADTTQMYEKKIAELMRQSEEDRSHAINVEEKLDHMKELFGDHQITIQQHEMKHCSYQKTLDGTTQMHEKKIADLMKQLEDEHGRFEAVEEQLDLAKKLLSDYQSSMQGQQEINELNMKLEKMHELHKEGAAELQLIKVECEALLHEKAKLTEDLHTMRERLLQEENHRKNIEDELIKEKQLDMKENVGKGSTPNGSNPLKETQSSQRTTIAKICEEVGLEKILALLASEDTDVQIHAVKVVANLAAEDIHQEKIVEGGGLHALLMLLQSSRNPTVLRVASGAIANLAMNELNQGLIMSKGGARLLANVASTTDDPQTQRMVAGAIANLCGNEKLHVMLKEDGGLEALLGMVRSGTNDVTAQVARGIANFAKCESRAVIQGHRKGRSLLMEDGALEWLLANNDCASTSIKRHIELALCHLAQNKDNWRDFMSSGAVNRMQRISVESSREDIRNLAMKTLKLFPTHQTDLYPTHQTDLHGV